MPPPTQTVVSDHINSDVLNRVFQCKKINQKLPHIHKSKNNLKLVIREMITRRLAGWPRVSTPAAPRIVQSIARRAARA